MQGTGALHPHRRFFFMDILYVSAFRRCWRTGWWMGKDPRYRCGRKGKDGSTVFEYREDNNFWFDGPVWTYYLRGTTLNPSLVGLMRGLLPDAEPSYQKGRAVLLFSSLFSSCECLDREMVLIQLLSLSAKRTRI